MTFNLLLISEALSSVSPKTFKKKGLICVGASLVAQMAKNLPAVQETWV